MRKVLGAFFILISTLIGTVVLLAWGIRTSLLVSEPWKASLREARVYDRLLVEALPEIVTDKSVADSVLQNAPLAPADLVSIAQETLTATFLQQQVEQGLDVVFNLLHGQALSSAKFVIPLQDIKRRLPIAVQERLVARVQALPICTDKQLQDFEKLKTLTSSLPPCRPKALDVQAIVRDSLKIDEITANIPATYDVIAELQKQRSNISNDKEVEQQTKDSGAATVEQQQANDLKVEVKTNSNKVDEGAAKKAAQQKVDGSAQKAGDVQQKNQEPSKPVAEQIASVQEKIQLAFRVHLYLTLAWVVLLLGLSALFIPHWRRVAQWFAVALFIPSTLLIAGTLFGKGKLPDHFTASDHTTQVLANIGQPVAAALVHVVTLRLLVLGGVGVAIAIIIFTLAYSFRRRLNP